MKGAHNYNYVDEFNVAYANRAGSKTSPTWSNCRRAAKVAKTELFQQQQNQICICLILLNLHVAKF